MAAERYTVTFISEPGRWSAPLLVRLRKFLKVALRCFGLRCVVIAPAERHATKSEVAT